jgi:hypothetical protein
LPFSCGLIIYQKPSSNGFVELADWPEPLGKTGCPWAGAWNPVAEWDYEIQVDFI